jgi:hypothetical protein
MKRMLFILPVLIASAGCLADDVSNIINSGESNVGIISLNQAAGVGNQQLNLRSLVIGGEESLALSEASQSIYLNPKALAVAETMKKASHSTSIDGSAFSHSHGIIGINQSAGGFNQTSNQATINFTRETNTRNNQNTIYTLDNAALIKTNAATESRTAQNKPVGNNKTFITDTAFQDTSGIVQINQVAGVMNQAANAVMVNVVAQSLGH